MSIVGVPVRGNFIPQGSDAISDVWRQKNEECDLGRLTATVVSAAPLPSIPAYVARSCVARSARAPVVGLATPADHCSGLGESTQFDQITRVPPPWIVALSFARSSPGPSPKSGAGRAGDPGRRPEEA